MWVLMMRECTCQYLLISKLTMHMHRLLTVLIQNLLLMLMQMMVVVLLKEVFLLRQRLMMQIHRRSR
jgi:hypothetical protein